jgi:DNA-directed RNA polymerase specialized sigma24 family protein
LEGVQAPDIEVGYFGSFVTSIPISSPALRRYRAERLLRKDFAGLRSRVLAIVRSRLRARGLTLDGADLEACYAQAWQGLYTSVLGGEQVESPVAWLVLVTFRRAIDESRCAARRQLAGEALPVSAFDPDLAGTLDDRAKLRQVFEGLRGRLSARECEAASLCYLQGLSRAQAAARMGLSEMRMRKLMDGAGPARPGLAGKVGAMLDAIKAGGWCEQQSSLMRAYAFGILDPDGPRHALAVLHCRECPACRAHVATLRGLAAVLPPLPLRLAFAGGVVGGAAGVSAGANGSTLAGSLTAKLALTGLIALALGGYAVLTVSAHHASPVHAHRGAVPRSARRQLYEVTRHGPSERAAAVREHPQRRRTARSSAVEAAAREFGPERVTPTVSSAVSAASHAPRRAAGVTSEFGFE